MGAHPKSQEAARVEKHLLKKIQGSPTSAEAHRQDYDETVRRLRDGTATEAAPKEPIYIAPVAPTQPPPNNPIVLPPDRYHKKNSGMVFITMDEFAGDDPDLNAGYAPAGQPATITAGIAKAKELAARRTDPNAKVLVSVHGGDWYEQIVLDDPAIQLVGIGMPRLWSPRFNDNTFSAPVVTITADATEMLFKGFEVINYLEEGDTTLNLVGLRIPEATVDTDFQPKIQVSDCNFHGNGMQVWTTRRASFTRCVFQSNYDANLSNNFPSVRVQAPLTHANLNYWTYFNECQFYAYGGNPATADYFDKGWAIDVTCIADDGLTWNPVNISGVQFYNSRCTGWTTNYGWTVVFAEWYGADGYLINKTSGSVHHRIFCNTDFLRDAFTYFEGGYVGCRYLAEINDAGTPPMPPLAYTNVWIRNFTHAGSDQAIPALIAGTSVHDSFSGTIPTGRHIYKAGSTTGATLGFYAPAGAELAIGSLSAFAVPILAMNNPFIDR